MPRKRAEEPVEVVIRFLDQRIAALQEVRVQLIELADRAKRDAADRRLKRKPTRHTTASADQPHLN
jgi:hypothetical protein